MQMCENSILKLVRRIFYILLIFIIMGSGRALQGREKLKIILTSNLGGRFSLSEKNQEKDDPLVVMGQSIIYEKKKGADIYLDLGNSFYPGALSKYNGAVMIDFFKYFGCFSTLVSSKDLRIGADILEFLQNGSKSTLLSANILQEKNKRLLNLFKPYSIYKTKNEKIAFVGLSSNKILFNIAEKNVFKLQLEKYTDSLKKVLDEIKKESVTRVIVLSGLDYNENIELMNTFDSIDLILAGGDNKTDLHKGNIKRVDLADGRSIISCVSFPGYYVLDISLEKTTTVLRIDAKEALPRKITSVDYREFLRRLSLWKKQFRQHAKKVVIKHPRKAIVLDQKKIAQIFRDKYDAEISIIKNDAVNTFKNELNIEYIDILSAINDNYSVFLYKLSGSDLLTVINSLNDYYFAGYENRKIQGYDIKPSRMYKIISTQSVWDRITQLLGKSVDYENTWKNISDIIIDDLKEDRNLYKTDFSYLDSRFRSIVDIYLSGFYESSTVAIDDSIETPPGRPVESYKKWSLEGKIDLNIYNDFHNLILTPYIRYSRQEDIYLHNLLRGTLFYNLNVDFPIRPYHKSQIDSVVVSIEGLRPTLIRETLGFDILSKYVNGNIGLGFEKQVYNPVEEQIYGFEAILKIEFDFFSYFLYNLSIDSFMSIPQTLDTAEVDGYIRSDIQNSLSFKINKTLSLSVKHKWFYYYSLRLKEDYSNSMIVASVNLNTDFKLY